MHPSSLLVALSHYSNDKRANMILLSKHIHFLHKVDFDSFLNLRSFVSFQDKLADLVEYSFKKQLLKKEKDLDLVSGLFLIAGFTFQYSLLSHNIKDSAVKLWGALD